MKKGRHAQDGSPDGRPGSEDGSESVKRTDDGLQPISPSTAISMYLDHRRGAVHERTVQAHRYRLKQFRQWLKAEGIDDLTQLTGRDIERYFQHRRHEQDVRETTIRGNSYTYKQFLEYCEAIDAVPHGFGEKVLIPSLDRHAMSRDHDLRPERVEGVLDGLAKYRYASRDHVVPLLLFHTGCRVGALHAVDVGDYDPDEQFIEFVNREPSTPLKNDVDGERVVHLSEDVVEVVEDYRRQNRDNVVDADGRRSLLTTPQGRLSISAMRSIAYRVTRPCEWGACPHDRDVDDCEALRTGSASKCPSSRAPHDIRSSAIMRMLKLDVPPEVVSERVNATQDVIDRHYDERTQRERMEQRREHLEVLG